SCPRSPLLDARLNLAHPAGETLVGRVMGLLAFSLLFTAGGALIGLQFRPGAILISIVGSTGAAYCSVLHEDQARTEPGTVLRLQRLRRHGAGVDCRELCPTWVGRDR